jgi:hypothetical protein
MGTVVHPTWHNVNEWHSLVDDITPNPSELREVGDMEPGTRGRGRGSHGCRGDHAEVL